MNTRDDLIKKLKKKSYREAFVSSQIDVGLPFQVRAIREAQDKKQEDLAQLTGMKQPRISAIERPGFSSPNLKTLKRIAAALDVALIVRFVSFGQLVNWAENFSPDTFNVPEFEKDTDLFKTIATVASQPIKDAALPPREIFPKQRAFESAISAGQLQAEVPLSVPGAGPMKFAQQAQGFQP